MEFNSEYDSATCKEEEEVTGSKRTEQNEKFKRTKIKNWTIYTRLHSIQFKLVWCNKPYSKNQMASRVLHILDLWPRGHYLYNLKDIVSKTKTYNEEPNKLVASPEGI